MESETIYNPDSWSPVRSWENYAPILSHFTVDFSEPLHSSEHPIINRLIAAGYEVRETLSSYFCGFPTRATQLSAVFKAQERSEYQICLKVGWLRFRFEGSDTVYLALFTINREQRGKGLGRFHFPRLVEAMFRAGARTVRGEVSPSYYEAAGSLDVNRLLRFYVHEVGFRTDGKGKIWKDASEPMGTQKIDAKPSLSVTASSSMTAGCSNPALQLNFHRFN